MPTWICTLCFAQCYSKCPGYRSIFLKNPLKDVFSDSDWAVLKSAVCVTEKPSDWVTGYKNFVLDVDCSSYKQLKNLVDLLFKDEKVFKQMSCDNHHWVLKDEDHCDFYRDGDHTHEKYNPDANGKHISLKAEKRTSTEIDVPSSDAKKQKLDDDEIL